jgi:autotransporter-associated beta strand protein
VTGGTNTVGIMDLTAANAQFGTFISRTNTVNATTVNIGPAQNLTVTGSVTVGFDAVVATNTGTSKLNMIGGGSFVANGPAAVVSVGVSNTVQLTALNTITTADLTGLKNVSLGTVAAPVTTVQVAFGQNDTATLLLADTAGATNSIAATTLNVANTNGLNGGNGQLTLGSGTVGSPATNTINADTINIGLSKNPGTISFASQAAGSPGSVTIANKAGTGGATIVIGSNTATGTSAVIDVASLDLRGHTATVNAASLTIGLGNSTGAGVAYGNLRFDAGTVTTANLLLGKRTGATSINNGVVGNAAIQNLLEIGGTGTFNSTTIASIGVNDMSALAGVIPAQVNILGSGIGNFAGINMAAKSGAGTGSVTGTITVSGGQLNQTATSSTSFVLASQATAGSATGSLIINGGVVTTASDITDGGGTATAVLTLNGGTLNMSGKNIGSATNLIDTPSFQSGTLTNVGQFNNGANLLKTTAGTLNMTGTSSYTGQTQVQAGTLTYDSIKNVGAGSSALGAPTTVGNGTIAVGNGASAATLQWIGSAASSTDRVIDLAGTTGGATLDASGAAAITYSTITASGSGAKTLTIAGTSILNNTITGGIPDSGGGATSLTKSGLGTWVLTGSSGFTGATTISGGKLLNNGTLSATASVTVQNTGTFAGTGSIAGPLTVQTGGTLAPGNSPGVVTLTGTGAAGAVTLASNSLYAVEVGGLATPDGTPGTYDQTKTASDTVTIDGAKLAVTSFNGFLTSDNSADPTKAVYLLALGGTNLAVAGGTGNLFVDPVSGAPYGENGTVTFPDGSGTATITYQANWSGDQLTSSLTGGNDVALFNINMVPEPGTASLLGLAGLGLLARRRRRRA